MIYQYDTRAPVISLSSSIYSYTTFNVMIHGYDSLCLDAAVSSVVTFPIWTGSGRSGNLEIN